jgi:hypothetical protein
MSYIINKTDGSILTEIIDGTIDQTATDLTLIGKNASTYGEFLNEDLVHLLENFANTTAPNNPIAGQLWFDTSENRLKIYDGAGFKVSGGTVVSNSVPILTQGDIWIDSARQQLYFNDGVATLLAGPGYTAQQGITGFSVVDVIDSNSLKRTIILLYVAQVLLGIFSKDSFTPGTPIAGYTGVIGVGFNVSNYSGVKIRAPGTQADALLAADGTLRTAESFLSTTETSNSTATLSLQNTTPLILGPASNSEIRVANGVFQINSNSINQNFEINSLSSAGLLPSLHIESSNDRVGIYTATPGATLDVNGDTIIRGSLSVLGDTTTINATNLVIQDKLIELGATDTPDNSTANGGGISLAAGDDLNKTIIWDLVKSSWTSSESFDIAVGKSYSINGFNVLSYSALGTTVASAPGLTSIGTLGLLQVSNLLVSGSTISFVNSTQVDGNIILKPKGAGVVDLSSARVINLAAPADGTDAVNLETLTNTIQTASLAISLDTTGLSNSQIAATYLAKLFPNTEHRNSALCRAVCTDAGTITIRVFRLLSGVWSFEATI